MTTCTILPNGLDWTVSTSVYSTFYAFHCDDVRHREAFNHAMGFNCVTSLLYHSWPPFFIKYSSFLLWLVAFLLLLASWTPPSPFVPLHLALVVVYGKRNKIKHIKWVRLGSVVKGVCVATNVLINS